jgi:uncharacterized membrane protein
MDTQKAFLVISITLIIVVLVNLAIYSMSKKGKTGSARQVKVISKALSKARDPWAEDDAKLSELSRLVDEIKSQNDDEKAI